MALPTVVAVGTVAASTTTIAPGIPTGTTTDDIMLLLIEKGGTDTDTTPTGWTLLDSYTDGGTPSTKMVIYGKVATSSESAPTVADGGNHQIGRIITIRGADVSGGITGAIHIKSTAVQQSTTTTAISLDGMTTTLNDCLVVAMVSHAVTATVGSEANANLGSVTERMDNTTTSGNDGGIWMVTGTLATAGAVGTTTATLSVAERYAGIQYAIAPLPTGTAYDETGLGFTATATITESDVKGFVDATVVTVAATVTEADSQTMDGTGGSSTVTATVDSTVNVRAMDGTGGSSTIVSTVTASDVRGLVEAVVVPVLATVSGADSKGVTEGVVVAAVATVDGVDLLVLTEAGVVVGVVTVDGVNVADLVETGGLVGIVSIIDGFDDQSMPPSVTDGNPYVRSAWERVFESEDHTDGAYGRGEAPRARSS